MERKAKSKAPKWLQISAAVIGNGLEWFDFGVYAALAVIIAKVYFPASAGSTAILLTLATFGVGFVTRPIGGILIGVFADRHGRQKALQLIIFLMTVALLIIVFTPSYASIGVAAPLLIVFSRLLQGIATGGEFATASAYLIEAAPPESKGFFGSWQMFGQQLAGLLSAITGFLLTSYFTQQELIDGMWRIPFVIGLVIAPVGWFIRRYVEEPEESVEARATGEVVSLKEIFQRYPRAILATLFTTVFATVVAYTFVVYLPTYATRQFHLNLHDAFTAQMVGMVVLCIMVPIYGWMSDRVSRKAMMFAFMLAFVVLVYPLFAWLQAAPSLTRLITIFSVLAFFLAGFQGPFTTALGEQFSTNARSSGLAICYNIAVMIFGGFGPFIVTWLIDATGAPLAPVFYIIGGGVVGLIGCLLLRPGSYVQAEPAILQRRMA